MRWLFLIFPVQDLLGDGGSSGNALVTMEVATLQRQQIKNGDGNINRDGGGTGFAWRRWQRSGDNGSSEIGTAAIATAVARALFGGSGEDTIRLERRR